MKPKQVGPGPEFMASSLTLTSITMALTSRPHLRPHCQLHQDTPIPRSQPHLLPQPSTSIPQKVEPPEA